MKRLFIFLFLLFTLNTHALLYLEADVGVTFGSGKINETNGSGSYKHDAFQLGAGFNFRAGLSLSILSFGGVYSAGQFSLSFTREDESTSIINEVKYQNTYDYTYKGFFVGIDIPAVPFRIWGEYYNEADLSIHYAKPKGENPFTKDDKLSGGGYGVGLAFNFLPWLSTYVIYRTLEFDKWEARNLPDDTYSKFKVTQLMTGAMITGDFF